MEENKLDKLFKENVSKLNGIPKDVKWNPKSGWDDYVRNHRRNKESFKILIYAISAAAILLIFILVLRTDTIDKQIYVENNSNQPKKVLLPCGNSVWLNRNSSIEYNSLVNKEVYEVKLIGEAYFELNEPKSKLYVFIMQNAVVELDMKASFNVRAYPDDMNVDITVRSGLLKVRDKDSNEGLTMLIKEGSYCSVHNSQKLVFASTNLDQNYLAWKTNKFHFDNTSMETVSEVLSEYYNKRIELADKNIAYCMFSGSYDAKNMDLILNQIQLDLELVIENTGNKITIIGQGCL